MASPRVEALLSALGQRGDPVAVIAAGEVVAMNSLAALLGDLPALAERALAAPENVVASDGRLFEVRAFDVEAHTILLGRDVGEREALEQALARSDAILSTGSHELKGPLHVIGMICHLIETRSGRNEAIDRTTIERLRRQVTRLTRLLDELLDASRLQQGRMVLDLEDVELVEVIRDQADAASGPGRMQDVTLALPEEAWLRGDRARLGALVFQLLDNAVRFSPPGTPVRLALEEEPDAWRLVATDEGPGVPDEEVVHLFERDRGTRKQRSGHGLGLGLYVAAAAVRLHQGTIDYARGGDRGAVFTVRLPKEGKGGERSSGGGKP